MGLRLPAIRLALVRCNGLEAGNRCGPHGEQLARVVPDALRFAFLAETFRRAGRCRLHDLISRAMLERYSHIRMAAKRTAMDSLMLNREDSAGIRTKVSKVMNAVTIQ
jgi:hypothetical protein